MANAYHLNNVDFSYNQKKVLSIETLDIRANKITALIGPNGCGKSTLLNLLAFLTSKQQGQMQFFAQPVSRKHFHLFIQRVSFLPQKPYMLRGSVVDNLTLALKFHQLTDNSSRQINNVLEQLNISHLALKQAKDLSGGEQQKVALARAIVTNPEVLLMDEPFSYLDHCSEQLLEVFIKDYVKTQSKTLIFSTHNRLQGIAIADDVISLIHGKVANSPLINLFQGTLKQQVFDTGKIKITMASQHAQGSLYVSIDPREIVLSVSQPARSIHNQYPGRVMAIVDEMGGIRVTVLAGELFQIIISLPTFKALGFSLGEQLWISFQAESILMF